MDDAATATGLDWIISRPNCHHKKVGQIMNYLGSRYRRLMRKKGGPEEEPSSLMIVASFGTTTMMTRRLKKPLKRCSETSLLLAMCMTQTEVSRYLCINRRLWFADWSYCLVLKDQYLLQFQQYYLFANKVGQYFKVRKGGSRYVFGVVCKFFTLKVSTYLGSQPFQFLTRI